MTVLTLLYSVTNNQLRIDRGRPHHRLQILHRDIDQPHTTEDISHLLQLVLVVLFPIYKCLEDVYVQSTEGVSRDQDLEVSLGQHAQRLALEDH